MWQHGPPFPRLPSPGNHHPEFFIITCFPHFLPSVLFSFLSQGLIGQPRVASNSRCLCHSLQSPGLQAWVPIPTGLLEKAFCYIRIYPPKNVVLRYADVSLNMSVSWFIQPPMMWPHHSWMSCFPVSAQVSLRSLLLWTGCNADPDMWCHGIRASCSFQVMSSGAALPALF